MHTYTTPELDKIWSRENRVGWWLFVEQAWLSALHTQCGLESERLTALVCRIGRGSLRPFLRECDELEASVQHDVEAFLRALENRARAKKLATRYLHLGFTSSDIVDTTLFAQVFESHVKISGLERELLAVLDGLSSTPAPRICRTHGQVAEKSTWGQFFRVHAARLLEHTSQPRLIVKLSGPTGQNHELVKGMSNARAYFSEQIKYLLRADGDVQLKSDTQVVDRIHLVRAVRNACSTAFIIEKLAQDLRLHSMLGEVSEGHGKKYVGSSSMPQKKNPIRLERISGLCRVIRSNLSALEETASHLWLERDISNSSVERMLVPETLSLAAFVVKEMVEVIRLLVIDTMKPATHIKHGVVDSHIIVNKLLVTAAFDHRSDAHDFMRGVVKSAEESGHSVYTVLKEAAREHKRGSAILRVL